MEINQSELHQHHYQTILHYMELHDCTYQQAEQQLKQSQTHIQEKDQLHTEGRLIGNQMEDQEMPKIINQIGSNDVIPLSQKELNILENYITRGYQVQPNRSLFESWRKRIQDKAKLVRRKTKCLRWKNIKKICRKLKNRENNNYEQLNCLDKSIITEEAKQRRKWSSCWTQIKDDDLEEIAELKIQQMEKYLQTMPNLVKSIGGLTKSGMIINLPENMVYPQSLNPILLVDQNLKQKINIDLIVQIQQKFEVIVLTRSKFRSILNGINQLSLQSCCAIGLCDTRGQMHIVCIKQNITSTDIVNAIRSNNQSIIKNSLFHNIKTGRIQRINFVTQQVEPQTNQDIDFSSEDDEENSKQQQDQHSSIIRQEQDMLYKSMLQNYHTDRQKDHQRKKSVSQIYNIRQKLRETIQQEPTQSLDTVNFTFRTPSGITINRNFMKQDSLQYLFDWVYTEEAIQFQDQQSRTFQLCEGYPPKQLQQDKNKRLGEVFDINESTIRIFIKEI